MLIGLGLPQLGALAAAMTDRVLNVYRFDSGH
jgi:hypothetical protein